MFTTSASLHLDLEKFAFSCLPLLIEAWIGVVKVYQNRGTEITRIPRTQYELSSPPSLYTVNVIDKQKVPSTKLRFPDGGTTYSVHEFLAISPSPSRSRLVPRQQQIGNPADKSRR